MSQQVSTTPKVDYISSAALIKLRKKGGLNDSYLLGTEAIGAGYDIFGYYASARSITVQLFDWGKVGKNSVDFEPGTYVPNLVDAQQQDGTSYHITFGKDISSYQKSIGVSVGFSGGLGLFSGSIQNDFQSSTLKNSSSEFTRIQQSITKWSLALQPNFSALRDCLHPDIKKRIDDAKSEADFKWLFDNYGSHFLAGIIMGGRATFSSSTTKTSEEQKYSNETVAKATYQSLTGQLSTSSKVTYERSISNFQERSASNYSVVGGNGSAATQVFSGSKADFTNWVDSVDTSPDFMNFMDNSNPIRGIWELAKNAEQGQAMQDYFNNIWFPAKVIEYRIVPNNYLKDTLPKAELTTKAKAMSEDIPDPSSKLKNKHRWVSVTIFNQTQFELTYKDSYFSSGRYEDKPKSHIKPFSSETFTGCDRDGSILTGVSGGTLYLMRMPNAGNTYNEIDLGIGFSNPQTGSNKIAVLIGKSTSAKKAYEAIEENDTSKTYPTQANAALGAINTNNEETAIQFQLFASTGKGNKATITITQSVVGDPQ